MTKRTLTPDICVIGAGAGGLAAATAAAAFGVPVVLIEHSRMGGESLHHGCVPSKALLAAARRMDNIRKLPGFGINAPDASVDFKKVRDHVRGVIAAIAPAASAERHTALGVQVISGTAQFIDRTTVAVGENIEIKARRFVIATGSSPAIPLMQGLETVDYLTNETIFDLTECPEHLIVVGAGAVGLELAQAFRRFGAAVSVIEARTPLSDDDPECVEILLAVLRREGIALHSGASVKHVVRTATGVDVAIENAEGVHIVSGSHLLLAAGRRPNVDSLDLNAARIRADANGILVNAGLKTSNKKVYAIGDVTGGPRFTHAATHQAGLVIRNALFRLPVRMNRSATPRVTFTDPEMAHVGLSEAEAHKKFRAIRILRWSYHDNDRARTERETRGHIKIIATKRGRILGATIVGTAAGELILTWTLAIEHRLNIRHIANVIAPYPTLGEISKRVATSSFALEFSSPFQRRIIGWLRKFG